VFVKNADAARRATMSVMGRLVHAVPTLAAGLALALLGGAAGAAAAYFAFDGYKAATMNFQTFSQITYAFTVTPGLMLTGVIYGLVLTFIAGLIPGISAARKPITTGLREL